MAGLAGANGILLVGVTLTVVLALTLALALTLTSALALNPTSGARSLILANFSFNIDIYLFINACLNNPSPPPSLPPSR